EQLVVGNAAPDEKRQSRGQLEVADAIDGVRGRGGRVALDAEQEVRIREHALERELNPAVEAAALAAARLVEVEERAHLGIGRWTAIGGARQPADDVLRARLFIGGARRPADEDVAPARRVGGTAGAGPEGTADGDAFHALLARLVARIVAIPLARLQHAFGFG